LSERRIDMSDRRPDEDDSPEVVHSEPPRYTRRLSDKILIAFHQACDQGELEVAEQLLLVLETVLTRPPPSGSPRRDTRGLVAAHERLWNLRHPTR
jgi:hypothetical protein